MVAASVEALGVYLILAAVVAVVEAVLVCGSNSSIDGKVIEVRGRVGGRAIVVTRGVACCLLVASQQHACVSQGRSCSILRAATLR